MDKLINLFLSNQLPLIAREIRRKADEDNKLNMYTYIKDNYNVIIDNKTISFSAEDIKKLKIIELDLDFYLQVDMIGEMHFEEPIMDELDVEDATNTFFELINDADKFLNRFIPYFSIGVLTISFIYIFIVSFFIVPSNNAHIIQSVTEFVKNLMIMVTSFWIGSSVGSETKTEEIDIRNEVNEKRAAMRQTKKVVEPELVEEDIVVNESSDDFEIIEDNFDEEPIKTNAKITTRDTFKKLLRNNDKFLRRFVPYLSVGIVISGFSYLFLASMITIPDTNIHLISSTIEFIKALILMVVSFWVGSSVSSKIKSNKLSTMKQKD